MVTSNLGLHLIKKFEGCRLKAYKALPTEKYWTIGYGHYGQDVTSNMTITQQEADDLLRLDLAKYERAVQVYNKIYKWRQCEFDALVSFCYNLGTGSIKQLTDNGTRSKSVIASKMLLYNKSGGKVIVGLVKRRQYEQEIFLGVRAYE